MSRKHIFEASMKRRSKGPGNRDCRSISGFAYRGKPVVTPRTKDDIWTEFLRTKPGSDQAYQLLQEYRAAGETITDEETDE